MGKINAVTTFPHWIKSVYIVVLLHTVPDRLRCSTKATKAYSSIRCTLLAEDQVSMNHQALHHTMGISY